MPQPNPNPNPNPDRDSQSNQSPSPRFPSYADIAQLSSNPQFRQALEERYGRGTVRSRPSRLDDISVPVPVPVPVSVPVPVPVPEPEPHPDFVPSEDFVLFPDPDPNFDIDEGPTVEHVNNVDAESEQRRRRRFRSPEHIIYEGPGNESDNPDVNPGKGTTEIKDTSKETTPTQRIYHSFTQNPPRTGSAMAANTTSTAAGVSPSSSPRLPSPPPFPEVQIGPKSPSVGDRGKEKILDEASKLDQNATRRIRPGTKAEHMASGPPLVPLGQLDSAFQLQEHLKALHHAYTKAASSPATTPMTRETARQLAAPPAENVDRQLWLYELCRFLVMKANDLLIAFFADNPPCSAGTCPEMRASEWQYLCAVHDPPKSCCAIDYCCHTLDWASNILTSPKYFPSRLRLGSDTAGGEAASMRHLTNIFRRVYRIFAHAWFQHRSVFWQVEGQEGLYVLFKTVCDVYQLIPEDNYTIPAEAEGLESNMDTPMNTQLPDLNRLSVLKKSGETGSTSVIAGSEAQDFAPGEQTDRSNDLPDASNTTISTGATTRRHKHTPSTGSQVTTIAEGTEEEEASPLKGDLASLESKGSRVGTAVNEEDDLRPLSREKTVTNLAEAGVGSKGEKKSEEKEVGRKDETSEKESVTKDDEPQESPAKIGETTASTEKVESGPATGTAGSHEGVSSPKKEAEISAEQSGTGTGDVEANEMMEKIDFAATGAGDR